MAEKNEQEEVRSLLASKTRDQINILARSMRIRKFRKMQKAELIDKLLESDIKHLNELIRLYPTWWQRYQNHIYGGTSILGVILAIFFFTFPDIQSISSSNSNRLPTLNTIQGEQAGESKVLPPVAPSPFQMNRDYKRRDALLNISTDWSQQKIGIISFEHINLKTLELLFSEKFIDPEERQNQSPSAKEFLAFMQSHPNVLAHGYAVSPTRDDYRITLEGLMIYPSYVSQELKIAFLEFCKGADEIETQQRLWCWWD